VTFSTMLSQGSHGLVIAVSFPSLVDDNSMPPYHTVETGTSLYHFTPFRFA
jgi:hypothetical protein